MGPDSSIGLLEIITAAVTPVVMISATAALILGIHAKHTALADRLRTLTAEFRVADTAARRENIQAQVALLTRRVAYAGWAHRALYAAVVAYGGMVLVITLEPRGQVWDTVALVLFVTGILLTLSAVIVEFLELEMGRETVKLEIHDVLAARNTADDEHRSATPAVAPPLKAGKLSRVSAWLHRAR
ncbi:MAG TPA: DUF2721 domain-containing protein [Nitrospiraceae bacterium]|nr:DUF2721 domain-containing protein [Nitrospiraceae bacterium]